jgi:hypothetical protein
VARPGRKDRRASHRRLIGSSGPAGATGHRRSRGRSPQITPAESSSQSEWTARIDPGRVRSGSRSVIPPASRCSGSAARSGISDPGISEVSGASVRKVPREFRARFSNDTARYCRTWATVSGPWRSHFERLGCGPEIGKSAMLGKIIIGLTAVAVIMVVPAMSASAQQTHAQQKKVTVNIPKQVCEIVTVGTENWGQQTVQVCGPPGGPRGQATAMSHKLKYRQAK